MVSVTIIPFLLSLIWQRQREEDFVFVFINAAAMLFPLYFIKNHKIYFLLLFPLLLIPAFLDFGHIFLYQGRITKSIFFIIFDTNPTESMEYVESNLSFQLIASVVLYLACMIIYWFKIIKLPKIEIETKWWKYLSLWILLPFIGKLSSEKGNIDKTLEAYRRSNHFYSMFYNYLGYKEQMKIFKSFDKRMIKDIKVTRENNHPEEEVHVLILEESTTSTHMGVYGYHRNTTPRLEELKEEIHFFSDVVCSNPPGTMANLKKILTLANTEDLSAKKLGANIVNIMNAAKFKTYWVSNQLILGINDTTTTVFAKQADITHFTNTTNSVTYDEKVLPILDGYLKDDVNKKFIVIHLIGTHMKYRNRYPEEFKRFNETNDISKRSFHNKKKLEYINQYDNSVLYHDHILAKIIQKLKAHNKFSTITYIADHGEEIYDIKDLHGHTGAQPTINMYRIPLFIWSSNKRDYSNYLERSYVSDDLIHTLFDLYDIKVKDKIPTKSIINPSFIEKTRYMGMDEI